MRTITIGAVATIVLIVVAVYFFRPHNTPRPATDTSIPSFIESPEIVAPSPSPPPIPTNNIVSRQSSRHLNGLTIDDNNVMLDQVDILSRVVDIPNSRDCSELENTVLEINNGTELTVSDNRGGFKIPYPLAANQSSQLQCLIISAFKEGYSTATVALPLNMENLPNIVELELQRNHLITGVVVDPHNDFVGNATVGVWPHNTSAETAECNDITQTRLITAQTDDEGAFNIDIPEEVDYCIQSWHPQWSRSEAQLISQKYLSWEQRLQLGSRLTVRGVTVGANATPIAGIPLQLERSTPTGAVERKRSYSRSQGVFFFFDVEQGPYKLSSQHGRYRISQPTEIFANPELARDGFTVTVYPVTKVSGQVFSYLGYLAKDVVVTLRSPYAAELTTTHTTTDDQGLFTIDSLHRADVAVQNFRMALAFVKENDDHKALADLICLDLYHPQHGAKSISLTAGLPDYYIPDIFLEPTELQFSGRVLNHRNQPLAATLIFTPLQTLQSQPLDVRLPTCEDLPNVRTVYSNDSGYFEFSILKADLFRVEVKTDRYQPRILELDLTVPRDDLEIKLN